jgi:hypothetical protein
MVAAEDGYDEHARNLVTIIRFQARGRGCILISIAVCDRLRIWQHHLTAVGKKQMWRQPHET